MVEVRVTVRVRVRVSVRVRVRVWVRVRARVWVRVLPERHVGSQQGIDLLNDGY